MERPLPTNVGDTGREAAAGLLAWVRSSAQCVALVDRTTPAILAASVLFERHFGTAITSPAPGSPLATLAAALAGGLTSPLEIALPDGRSVALTFDVLPQGTLALAHDVTPHVVAAKRLEGAARRAGVLADVTRGLAGAVTPEQTLADVARLAVPAFADSCLAYVRDGEGLVRRVTLATAPERAHLFEALRPYETAGQSRVVEAIRTKQAFLVERVPADFIAQRAVDERHAGLLRELDCASFVVVPVVKDERVYGSLSFIRGQASAPYEPDDLVLAQRIAAVVALTIDHALLFVREQGARATSERAAAAARLSEERYRTLVTASSAIVWTTSAEGAFVTEQPSWAAFTGQPWSVHQGFGWAEAIHPADREAVLDAWRTAIRGVHVFEFESRHWHAASAAWVPVQVRAAPVLNAGGSIREWVGTCTDVSARRKTEQLKERLVAMVSHDLRNPLSAVRASAQLLARDPHSTDRHREMAARIDRASGRMNRLIAWMLDLARVREGGGLALVRRPTDLAAVAGDVIEELNVAYPDRPISLTVDGDTNGTWDPDRLAEVLSNLGGNALAYGAQMPVFIGLSGTANGVTIEVRNGGPPIPPRDLPHLFEAFRRGGTKDEKISGLGLGLYIVKAIVDAHAGTIEIRSDAGTGTVVTVRLPREQQ